MHYLIGTDEAGYGPNLGPLVVTATVWQLPDASCFDLYSVFRETISASVPDDKSGLIVADSKALYKPRGKLTALEHANLAMLAAADNRLPGTWREIWPALDPDAIAWIDQLPWYADYNERLPVSADLTQIAAAAERLRVAFETKQVRLLRVCSHVVFANHFNRLLDRHTNKSESLSRVTLELVHRALDGLPPASIRVECDKHGGRNKYGALLQRTFPDHLVEVYDEGRQRSLYRFGPPERRFEFLFSARGESALPTALASMFSKYLRELAMRAFNTFWKTHVDELRPTAGYPVDARRFKKQISPAQSALGIKDSQLWRAK
jgi:hypothetical protein